MILIRIVSFLSLISFAMFCCNKEENRVFPSVGGMYIGNTLESYKSNNSTYGYQESNTTYTDTFYIELLGTDSISFIDNTGHKLLFVLDSTNIYSSQSGPHGGNQYIVKPIDSLVVNYWTWGGYGGNYNSSKIIFKGLK